MAQQGDCKKSRTAPLNAVITIIIIIIIIIIITNVTVVIIVSNFGSNIHVVVSLCDQFAQIE